MKGALTKLGFGKIKHFCERDATSKAVMDYFKDECFGGDELDRLLVVFMGHGKHDERGNSYFITADYRGEAEIAASTITKSDIEKILNDAKAKHTMVVIDACEYGTADFGVRGGQTEALTAVDSTATNAVLHWKDAPSRCLLTGTYRVQAGNVEDGAGLFARELVSSLQGPADENGDRLITTTELYQYCARSVQRRLKEKGARGEAIEKQDVSVVWYSPGDDFHPGGIILTKPAVGQMFFVLPIATY